VGTPAEQRLRLARGVLRRPPVTKPGSEYLYANAGTALAGMLAERAAKQDYEALIAKRLFEPLGIRSAGFGPPGRPGALDEPCGHRADGKPVEPGLAADNPPAITPAGTVHMTIGDWGKFVSLHLLARRGKSPLLGRASAEHLHTPAPKVEPPYACGWMAAERPWGGGTVLTHSGSNTMWYCVVWMAPGRDFAVLVCTNTAGERAERGCDAAAAALIEEHLRK
jgi:CubicO group peptidase (beta-lactamase class C family)